MDLNGLALLFILSIAVGTDLCDGKVYNKWIVAGVSCAGILLMRDVVMGKEQWYLCVDRIAGMLLPVVILMVFFSFGVIGGGDVKLFSMIGAFVGWRGVLSSMVLSLLPAAVMALGKMLIGGSLGKRFRYFHLYFRKMVLSGEVMIYEQEHTKEGTIFLSVPIMIGVWMYLDEWWVL